MRQLAAGQGLFCLFLAGMTAMVGLGTSPKLWEQQGVEREKKFLKLDFPNLVLPVQILKPGARLLCQPLHTAIQLGCCLLRKGKSMYSLCSASACCEGGGAGKAPNFSPRMTSSSELSLVFSGRSQKPPVSFMNPVSDHQIVCTKTVALMFQSGK